MCYSKVSTDMVLRACDNYLSDVEKRIYDRRKKLIEKEIIDDPAKFFDLFTALNQISMEEKNFENKIKNLKTLCMIPYTVTEEIIIDTEMASLLNGYWK